MSYGLHRFPLHIHRFSLYIGFHHCISVVKLCFFNTPFTLDCSFKFLFRAHAGFIIAQLKTLSISRGCQRNNNTLIVFGERLWWARRKDNKKSFDPPYWLPFRADRNRPCLGWQAQPNQTEILSNKVAMFPLTVRVLHAPQPSNL